MRTLFGPVSLPYGLMYPFEHMRAGLSSACASLFGEHAPLLNAMLWGVKGGISDSAYDAFRSCGIAHILALSGLHVSFVVGALNRLTRRALPKVKFYTSIVVLFAYCAIAAFPSSLIRASVMSLCSLYAAAAGRRYDMPSGIPFSAIVILLADPTALYSIGFELSFGAVIMISLLMRPVTELLSFLPLPIAQMAALSVCGTLGTLPLSVYYFGTIPVLGLFANTLILPMVPFVFLSAMAVNLIGIAMPAAAKALSFIPMFLTGVMTEAANAISSVSFAVKQATITPLACLFVYLACFAVSDQPLVSPSKKYAACAASLFAAVLCML